MPRTDSSLTRTKINEKNQCIPSILEEQRDCEAEIPIAVGVSEQRV